MAEKPRQHAGRGQASANRQPQNSKRAVGPKGAQQAARTKGPAQGRPRQPQRPDDVPMLYGAEAIAAVTVAESKLSKFKGRAILGLLLACCSLVIWNSFLHASKPEAKLLGLTVDNRVLDLPLLDEPLESRQTLFDWIRRNIPDLYDFNYSNYKSELGKARNYTHRTTLEQFQSDLETSGILPKVRNDYLILRANIVDEPIVVNETTTKGRRLWIVEIPMTLVYDSGQVENGQRKRITQDILFTAYVVRANIIEYDGGLMLAKYSYDSRR